MTGIDRVIVSLILFALTYGTELIVLLFVLVAVSLMGLTWIIAARP